jgi:hypothetical protein
MNRRRQARHGYALMLVMVFVVLFLAMLGVAWRQVASVLRVETVRQTQARRDRGCLQAVVNGIQHLDATPTIASGEVWSTTIDGRSFNVTFTQPEPTDTTIWSVDAVPSP